MVLQWASDCNDRCRDLIKGLVLGAIVLLTYPQVWALGEEFAITVYPLPWPGILLLLALCAAGFLPIASLWDRTRIGRMPAAFWVLVAGSGLILLRLALSFEPAWLWLILATFLGILFFPLSKLNALVYCTPVVVLAALRAVAAEGIWVGTFGNRNFFATYLAAVVVVVATSIGTFIVRRSGSKARDYRAEGLGNLWVLLSLGLVAIAALVRCWSRGAWFGLVGGLSWMVLVRLRVLRERPLVRASIVVAMVIGVLTLSWMVQSRYVQGSDVRPYLWRGGWELVAQNPLVGVGPERMIDAWPSVRPPEYTQLDDAGDVSPYVHHWALQFWIDWGVPVGSLWILFLAGALALPLRGDPHRAAMQGVLALILFQNSFDVGLFHSPLRELALWTAASLWSPMVREGFAQPPDRTVFPSISPWLPRLGIGLFMVVVAYHGCLRPWLGNLEAEAGHLAADRSEWSTAVPRLAAAVAWGPGPRREERYRLGYCLAQAGEHEAALQVYLDLARISPDRSNLNANLTRLLLRLGRFEEALSYAERQVELYPLSADDRVRYASCLLELGRMEEGRAALYRALELDPAHAFAQQLLIRLDGSGGEPSR
ncbi:MAG: tetratricopeptide repeat protein [Verrucomicrobiota bacterium]|nr:tetratricopeptide repeat protein [Verrucomicrobiota bacterium]